MKKYYTETLIAIVAITFLIFVYFMSRDTEYDCSNANPTEQHEALQRCAKLDSGTLMTKGALLDWCAQEIKEMSCKAIK